MIRLLPTCVFAPMIEETLARGLGEGVSVNYGKMTALIVSASLFALLRFDMLQTLSALIRGIVLGMLYFHTGSCPAVFSPIWGVT